MLTVKPIWFSFTVRLLIGPGMVLSYLIFINKVIFMPLHMLSNIEYLDARRAVASFRNIVTARKTCTSGFEGGGGGVPASTRYCQ